MEAVVRRAAEARADVIRTFLQASFVRFRAWRTKTVLDDLEDRLLDDIGVRREQIPTVARRSGRRWW
jgi:uncharacterized protein YjiS (DUF1127 family)